ncbi:TonB-dependent receptor [Bryobacter aggregatus]|uniref:TonB-dependent receptor n=1 Tax=Bryobacter aggregatus TaxID=360054 RepID=UPI0004E0E548|nr:TonB-dependent receptor [Bryobacter aggregatus]
MHNRILFAVFCSLATTPLVAQTFQGAVVGTITDASGSTVPQANITLLNLGTSDRRTAKSDDAGSYQFVSLVPGQYRIEIEKTGFRRFVREPITVEVQSSVRIDIPMQLGDTTQTVEVTTQTPLLQTEDASLGQVVQSRKVLEMPLNGRNVFGLVALVPGVVPGGQSGTTPTGTNVFAWGNYQIGGGQANQSAAFIDGAPINAIYANLTALVPTQDAIQEFRVQTNNLGPEFGHLAGGAINLATKSGSNAFHGTAYEYLRNRSLNANTFFNNRAGVKRPAFTQNQYGTNVGGPVIRDKTFFFGGWEGFRLRQGMSYVYSVPTDEMRAGNFSNLRNAAGAMIPIYDPLTTCGRLGNAACARDANGNEVITRQVFPGNVIPQNRFDPAARVLSNLWGRANGPGSQFTNVNNFTANASVGGQNDQYNARIDHNVSEKQRLFVRYTFWKNLNLPIDPYGTKTCVDRCTETFNTNQAVIADTYSITPTLVADVRVAYMRFHYDRTSLTQGYDLTQLGWPAALNNQVVFRVVPQPSVTGYNGVFSTSGTGSTISSRNDVYSLAPSLTKIWGNHTMKFGADLRRSTHNYYQQNNPSGNFNFDALLTSANPFAAAGTGNGFASFLLGYGSGGGINQNALVAAQILYRAFYAGDQWRLNSRLTLNYGIRYEQMGPWSERYDRLSVLLPDVENPLSSITGLKLKGRLGLVNSPDSASRNNQKLGHLFSPRVGIAYRLSNTTVIRSGYGIFYLPNDVRWNMAPNNDAVNSFNNPFNGTLDGSLTPLDRLGNPFPNGLLQTPGRSANLQKIFYGQGVSGAIFNDPFSYAQQWNFDVQHELPGGLALSVAYAGSKGTHLPGPDQQLNQLPNQYMALGSRLQEQVPNPFYGQVALGTLAQPLVAYGQLLRPYPQYTGFAMKNPTNRNSTYHSAQLNLQKRFGAGGSIVGAYTWSKLISDTDTLTGWLEPAGGAGGVQDNFNIRAERSLALYDTPHRGVISYIVDLPFGKGRRFGSHVTGVADRFVSGWGVNGVSTFQSGAPLPISVAVNTNVFGAGQRPNRTGQPVSLDGSAQDRLNRWFNPAAFSLPAAFSYGNAARSMPDMRSHGIANYDFTLFKNTSITERVGLQFRAEIFNLFNRVRFAAPGTALGNPQFGVVSGQYNDPRLVQLALRLVF